MTKTGKEKYTAKNNDGYHTVEIFLEELNQNDNLIIVYNE